MLNRCKQAKVIALAAVLVGLSLAGARADADDDLKRQIIGRWGVPADPSCEKASVQFTADGAVSTLDNRRIRTGKYVVVASRIVVVLAAPNPDDPPLISLVRLEGGNLKGADATGKDPAIVTFTRCPR